MCLEKGFSEGELTVVSVTNDHRFIIMGSFECVIVSIVTTKTGTWTVNAPHKLTKNMYTYMIW